MVRTLNMSALAQKSFSAPLILKTKISFLIRGEPLNQKTFNSGFNFFGTIMQG